MKISTLRRHFREGTRSMYRNGWMTFASISSITISLFILGLFLMLGINVNYMSNQLENQVTIKVYLELKTPQAVREEIQTDIQAMPEVKKVVFVSKEEALKTMRETMGDPLEGLDGENNPLPDGFVIEVKEPRTVQSVTEQIQKLNDGREPKPIEQVKYGKGTVDALFKVTTIVRNIGIVFVVALVFTSMFLISNTIKLTILARNREIKIMKLVGATNGFIRWPFFIEGALIGFQGALIPAALLTYGYHLMLEFFQPGLVTVMLKMSPFKSTAYPIGGVLMAIGLVIGIWGSTISVRKFLKV
ncbi:permease-like cell division protein FtsX [Gorillibacterium timonense]|uniref:permease-like cell division protein FtsX n=1 Tax=Gorillibacterium timonense TaxID=1689269 RepID=UPI00071D4821|nr:permease-like cell division protein FtsX [Gorillibacterium timonense]